MNLPPDPTYERLDALLGALRDGTLTPEETTELRQRLDTQPGAYRRLCDHMLLVSALEAELPALAREVPAPSDRLIAWRPRWPTWLALGAAAAAAVVALLVRPSPIRSHTAPPSVAMATTPRRVEKVDHGVAVLTQTVGTRWQGNERGLKPGAALAPGRWQLEAGVAKLEFYCGAALLLEGQTDLEIVSDTEVILHRGKLRAQVPFHARGFTVRSRELKLVDRGTEFGIGVDDRDGTQVHVFKGRVEVYDPAASTAAATTALALAEGAGVWIDPQLARTELAADATRFVSAGELERQLAARLEAHRRRWQEFGRQLSADARLLAGYTFEPNAATERILDNISPRRDEALHGAIVGCGWAEGRWPGKRALEFKRPSDRVRVTVPGQHESLTLCAWVRMDGLDNAFNSLLLSDGWNRPGAVHWQIMDDGCAELAVSQPRPYPNSRATQVITPYDLGRWIHLAVVYDGPRRRITHYRDGVAVGQSPIAETVPLALGVAQIGNWDPLKHPDARPIRNFNGRIDEFAIFNVALSGEELARCYDLGRPVKHSARLRLNRAPLIQLAQRRGDAENTAQQNRSQRSAGVSPALEPRIARELPHVPPRDRKFKAGEEAALQPVRKAMRRVRIQATGWSAGFQPALRGESSEAG